MRTEGALFEEKLIYKNKPLHIARKIFKGCSVCLEMRKMYCRGKKIA